MAEKDGKNQMNKKQDFILEGLPGLDIPESFDTLMMPAQNTDAASQSAETVQFRTEEILTIIEKKISEAPKHRKRNRVKDVFRKKK